MSTNNTTILGRNDYNQSVYIRTNNEGDLKVKINSSTDINVKVHDGDNNKISSEIYDTNKHALSTFISNFPATQSISGAVSVSNFPLTQAISGAVDISNLPLTQAISGAVDINNFPSTQAISGAVSVSNFPSTQAISGAVSVSNLPITQAISGAVDINNFPSTQAISGAVSVSNLPTTQAISGAVSVSNFPVTQIISGAVDINNFPSTQAISGAVSVNNLPTTQAISGAVSISNFPITQAISGAIDINNFPTTQAISGAVSVSNFPTTQAISGAISVSNNSIDVHCYASSNGTTWHHLSSDANGQLNVHAKLQDGNGTDLTSTLNGVKQSLDVNVSNPTLSISGAISLSNSTFTTNAGTISTTLSSLNTASALYCKVDAGGGGTGLNILDGNNVLVSGVPKNALYVNDVNGNTYLQSFFTNGMGINPSSNTVKLDSSNNTVKIDSSNNLIKLTDGTNTASVSGTVTNLLNKNALNCNSNLYALNTSTGDINPLTVYLDGNHNQLEVYDKDNIAINLQSKNFLDNLNIKAVQQYNTTNTDSKTGLNVNIIKPDEIIINMGGYTNSATTTILGYQSASNITTWNYFRGATKYLWLYSTATQRTLTIRYTNLTGDLATATQTVGPNAWVAFTNNGTFSGLVDIQSDIDCNSGNILWSVRQVNIAPTNNSETVGAISSTMYFNGLITIPNGYRGVVNQYYISVGNVSTQVFWYIWKPTNNGFRGGVLSHSMAAIQNFTDLNLVFEPGDTVCLQKASTSTDTYYQCKLILRKI